MSYRKILILGGSCSGRSWLARSVSEVTGLPSWDPGARGVDPHAARREALAADAWILEESATAPDPRALEHADLVVLLCTPLWLRLLRRTRAALSGARRGPPPEPSPDAPRGRGRDFLAQAGARGFLCRSADDVCRLLVEITGVREPPRASSDPRT